MHPPLLYRSSRQLGEPHVMMNHGVKTSKQFALILGH